MKIKCYYSAGILLKFGFEYDKQYDIWHKQINKNIKVVYKFNFNFYKPEWEFYRYSEKTDELREIDLEELDKLVPRLATYIEK